jgi:PAS domain S-box-containing protein
MHIGAVTRAECRYTASDRQFHAPTPDRMNPLYASSHDGSGPGSGAPRQLPFGTWHWDETSGLVSFTVSGRRDEAATRLPMATWLATVSPPEREQLPHIWQHASRSGSALQEFEIDVTEGGEVRRLLLRGHGSRRGEAPGAAGIWLDVTNRAIGQSRAWFRHLADALPTMMWAATPAGVIDFANDAWLRFTGLESAGDWTRAIHPDDLGSVEERWRIAVETHARYEARCRVRRAADGTYRWHSVRAVPIVDGQGRVARWLGALVDEHELRMLIEANQQLLASEQRARQAAEDAGRMKEEFLSVLGHELRTPLNAISGWASMLKRGGMSDVEAARAVEVIERNAEVQRHLIDQLLDVSRVISGHIRLDVQPFAVEDALTRAIDALRPEAEAKGVRILADLTATGAIVQADPGRLQQAFANLVGNAVKFTPPGGEVRVRAAREGPDVRIRVHDSGVGIPAAFLPHVFDRFRQAESQTARRFGGLGLGLSIVRQIVHMHGGRVEAFSDGEGHGAEFVVTLGLEGALVEPPSSASAPVPRPVDSATLPLRGLSMLVIEDDADSREMLSVLLENAGAVPVPAASVTEALRLLGDLEVDVVLSDIGMPDRDGFDLIRSLRNFPNPRVRRAPAVAVTAFARTEDRDRILAAGFDAHVSKPVEPLDLFRAVAAVRHQRVSDAASGPGTPSSP